MRLRAKSTQRHTGCDETLADRCHAFHFINIDCFAHWLDGQQIAQVDRRIALHFGRILLPHLERASVTRGLHHMHGLRFPRMGFTAFASFVEAANRQNIAATLPAQRVNFFRFELYARDTNAADAGCHTGEEFSTHRARQANRLEVQTTAIRGHNRDTHLRHDLEQALINRFAITRDSFG